MGSPGCSEALRAPRGAGRGGHTGLMESELVRALVEGGGTAATRCLAWLVDGAPAGAGACVDVVWPAAPVEL
ncbi:conserved hypothetical protein [uncultured Mycobacterium sp.]|jgi:hypothetical protein|uniref:Uncharacterized protein n=1 Tax=uncultured Mycobacterium sp. TaxID=171292 RepID=A0A1Y5PHD7_9MYCO|nr:hypothetical protein MycrhDRAFT_3758 [Mycolicibacterium rhodesiae JS60]SBS78084.1 conserved hypothetical protein [uncultured Mycobacterium sp.]